MEEKIITWKFHPEVGRISCDGLDLYNWLLDKNKDIAEEFYTKMIIAVNKNGQVKNFFPKK